MTLLKRPAAAGLVLCAFLAACDQPVDSGQRDGEKAAATELAQLACTVTVASGAMTCAPATPSTGAGSGLIAGRQGENVFLQASNHTYDGGDQVYSIDVTVQNLVPQAMGTTDGATLDPAGVRVFFAEEPVATGGNLSGTVELLGESRGMFTEANQAYFQYDEVLQTNQTSEAKTWEFSMPSDVTSFHFRVFVIAQVQFPAGWIDLTPAADTMVEGATAALTATVRTPYGVTIPGQTVTWGSSNTGVATVDGSGVVTAVAPGQATITGTAGLRGGTAIITVCPDLAVGEAYTATMPAAAALCFAGGASDAAEYAYMPINLSTASSLALTVTGSGIQPVTGPPSPALLPGAASGPRLGAPLVDDGGLHVRRMERERGELARLAAVPTSRISRARGTARAGGPRFNTVSGTPAVGDLWTLNVAQSCSGTRDDRTGRVVSVGEHVIVVADTTNPAGGFTTAQYDSIRLEFDSLAYPVDTTNFGGPTDLDDNQRVVAFYTRAVNELSPPASSVVTLGYFTARDLFSSAPESCPRSNQGEIFYMLTPDPTGAVNSNVRTVAFVRGSTVGTMAHELQHLINASRRVYLNGTWNALFEEVWLNEGLSHISEELMFYQTSAGLAPRGDIQLSTLTSGPLNTRRVAAFNSYANSNFTRLRSWLQRPDTTGAFKNADNLATRGAIWAYLRYAADRRNGDDAALWYSLVNTQTTGQGNLQQAFGADPQVWLRDFTSAMYADGAVSGIGAAQQITSWNFRSVYGGLGGFPLGAQLLTNGTGLTLSYSRGGGTTYARFGVPMGGFAGVTALSGGAVPTSPYSLIVVRTK